MMTELVSYMDFPVAHIHSTTFIFTFHRSLHERNIMFNLMSETIDAVISEYASAGFHICGNINIHPLRVLSSPQTKPIKKEDTNSSLKSPLVFLMNRIFRRASLISPSHPAWKKSSSEVLLPLITSDHSLSSVKVYTKPMASPRVPFHGSILFGPRKPTGTSDRA